MKTFYNIILVLLFNLLFLKGLLAFDNMQHNSSKLNIDSVKIQWRTVKNDELESWKQYKEKEESDWVEFKKKVELKWLDFTASTRKDWVEYNKTLDSRSRVDFKAGKIVVEAVVPVKDLEAEKKAKLKIARQLKKIFGKDNTLKEKMLDKQVVNKQGKIIEDNNLDKFITNEVLPSVKLEKKIFKAKDNVRRKKYKTSITLVPNHIKIRVSKYIPLIEENARKFNISPQLVMAIIHTESYFNPLAISKCGAIGLMQVIPDKAGRETYRYLFGRDKIVTQKYLYNPANNIMLGTAYLYLLKNIYFNDIKDPIKNRSISICGYNWGPTAVRDKIIKQKVLKKLSMPEFNDYLNHNLPKETRLYLHKVQKRINLYDSLFI